MLGISAALGGMEMTPAVARKALLGVHALAVSLLPVALVFWYFVPITNIQYERVYFTYDNALFFLADGLALVPVLAWVVVRLAPEASQSPRPKKPLRERLLSLETWLLAFCTLVTLSLLWSTDWRVTLYLSLHCWLVLGLFFSLRDRPQAWRRCAAQPLDEGVSPSARGDDDQRGHAALGDGRDHRAERRGRGANRRQEHRDGRDQHGDNERRGRQGSALCVVRGHVA